MGGREQKKNSNSTANTQYLICARYSSMRFLYADLLTSHTGSIDRYSYLSHMYR